MNHYSGLHFDDQCIAVDYGASEGFADEDTPGTNRIPLTHGVTMVSATGGCRESTAKDAHDVPLSKAVKEFHVMSRGEVKRPLLSTGKACNAGCKVSFD